VKLGAFNILFLDRSFAECVTTIRQVGCDAIEIAAGGYTPKTHCNPAELLADRAKLREFRRVIDEQGLEISAISCHGNPLHPNRDVSRQHAEDIRLCARLAAELGVVNVVGFAGCPGDSENATYPNWVTCPWPDDFSTLVNWQWEAKVIPFWTEMAETLRATGTRYCLEMHPGDVVYTPEKLLRLRDAVGPELGCNFDPSHLFWQQIDPAAAVRILGDAIYHVHMKDSKVDPLNVSRVSVLDTKPYTDEINRGWIFRTVGYGHDESVWRDIVSNLRLVGYDGVLSIEHEDSLMAADEGLQKAIAFLKDVMIEKPRGKTWFEMEHQATG
jgi:sugar phosphate isomerase/epimerase